MKSKVKEWLGNKLLSIALYLLPKVPITQPDEYVKREGKYRLMIIQLLETWDKPIPQKVRNKAYDLLDKYAEIE